VKTKRISFDFNEKFTAAELEKIWKDNGLGELDISVFINHATFYPGLNTFEKISEEQVDEMVSVNCYLPVFFSKLAIESFKRRYASDPRLHSLILFNGGHYTIQPARELQVYNATKIFNEYLCDGLSYELEGFNVDCRCLKSDTDCHIQEPGMAPYYEFNSGNPYGYYGNMPLEALFMNLICLVVPGAKSSYYNYKRKPEHVKDD